MLSTAATVFGGIGLFLLGMVLMTDGLKALAGDALRGWLARFTGSRLSAVASGAGLTALVQSSSATTLATIGFVSAGLLSFNNAIGVIIGANLGTTSTGWIVSLLGLKFSIGTVALPLIGVGALLKLLGRERMAQAGIALAGFGVIFVGIDVLQAGMADLSNQIDLSRFAVDGWWARVLLVGIGMVMTVVMQSSSAAVATTLTALATGTVNLDQAAALVIGQNVGTTVTAGIAAVGAQTAAKRTAVVHVAFNVGTGFIAFLLLPAFAALGRVLADTWIGEDPALTLAAFHTAFNLLGAVIFIPLIPQLGQLAERLVPEHRTPLARHLDQSLTTVPALALDAARRTLDETVQTLVTHLRHRLGGSPAAPLDEALATLPAAANFLARMPELEPQRLAEWSMLIQQLDHAQSLARLLEDPADMSDLLLSAILASQRQALAVALQHFPSASVAEILLSGGTRAGILERTASRSLEVAEAFRALAGQRTLEEMIDLLERLRPIHRPSAEGGVSDVQES